MPDKKLNNEAVREKLQILGMNQTDLASKLCVSRETVSQWLKGKKQPRPRILLKLSKVLELDFESILLPDVSEGPIFAYRTNKNKKVTEVFENEAEYMGNMLKVLIPYLKSTSIFNIPVIKSPENEYSFIQNAALEVKKKMQVTDDKISFPDILKLYDDFHLEIIPVMWGENNHNGLIVQFPKQQMRFIYANLEKLITDFKFWLLHELAHAMTPSLENQEADQFADALAGAILFPQSIAQVYYTEFSNITNKGTLVNRLLLLASNLIISPITILKEINDYAAYAGKSPIDLEIYGAVTNFNKNIQTVSEIIFEEKIPDVERYIQISSQVFGSSFFDALKSYLKTENKEYGVVQRIMNIPLADAKGVYNALVR